MEPSSPTVLRPAPAQTGMDDVRVDLAALFAAHAPFLVRSAHRLCCSREVAEDVVQETFLIAHQKRDQLVAGDAVRGWLYRVMAHRVSHWRRGARRRQVREDRVAPPSTIEAAAGDAVEAKARALRVHDAVQRLPLPLREVFVLFELEGMSGADIAALRGIPVNTVWTRLKAARERFRRAYERAERRER